MNFIKSLSFIYFIFYFFELLKVQIKRINKYVMRMKNLKIKISKFLSFNFRLIKRDLCHLS